MKIAFQGVAGAFSELAATKHFPENKITTLPCNEFKDVFHAVEGGKAQAGVIPIENSNAGSIFQNYDLLLSSEVWITGEVKLRVKHNLLGKAQAKLADVKKVLSHPQALMQCSAFLEQHGYDQLAFYDTAGAAKWVSESDDYSAAAIAGELAAKTYGLKILKRGIENNKENYTRFFIIERKERRSKVPSTRMKTSIVFALNNTPGGLHKALSVFAIRDIDLLKLQSRPIPGSPWKYYFYLDFDGSIHEESCGRAIEHLKEITKVCRVFGSYPICS